MTRHIGRSLHNGRSCLAGRQWLSSHLLRGADAVANRLDSWPNEARRLLLFGRQQRGFFMRPGWWRERNRCSGSTVARVGHDCSRVLPISRPGRGARPCACGRCGIRILLSAGSQRVSAHSPPDCRAGVRRTCLIWQPTRTTGLQSGGSENLPNLATHPNHRTAERGFGESREKLTPVTQVDGRYTS